MTHRYSMAAALLASVIACTGCAGLTAMQGSVAELDDAAHAATEAQEAFLTAYRVSECRNANLDRIFSSIETHRPDLTLQVPCSNVAVSDADVEIRATLLATIALYADKLQALAGGDSTSMSASAESTAKSINGFGKSSGLRRLQLSSGTDEKAAHVVETAVIGLTDFVLEHKKFKTIEEAALSQQPRLEIVVDRLKQENALIGQAFENNLTGILGTIRLALAKERHDKAPSLFFDIVAAQDLVAGYTAISAGAATRTPQNGTAGSSAAGPVSTSGCALWMTPPIAGDGPKPNPPVAAAPEKPVNDLLDAIVEGNRALSQSRPQDLKEAARRVQSCGKSVSAIYQSLNK